MSPLARGFPRENSSAFLLLRTILPALGSIDRRDGKSPGKLYRQDYQAFRRCLQRLHFSIHSRGRHVLLRVSVRNYIQIVGHLL